MPDQDFRGRRNLKEPAIANATYPAQEVAPALFRLVGQITEANLAENSAGWSGKAEVLLTTRPHQVDRRQQVSGETGYGQQYGDCEREGEPLGRATDGRVQGGNLSRAASCRAQCGHEAEEESHQAGGGHEGGD